jgi:hypothetical protein
MPYHFVQVDVFTRKPLYGNPAAVFFDADGLDTKIMQKIAQEMNLSETVFLCKPTAPEMPTTMHASSRQKANYLLQDIQPLRQLILFSTSIQRQPV